MSKEVSEEEQLRIKDMIDKLIEKAKKYAEESRLTSSALNILSCHRGLKNHDFP